MQFAHEASHWLYVRHAGAAAHPEGRIEQPATFMGITTLIVLYQEQRTMRSVGTVLAEAGGSLAGHQMRESGAGLTGASLFAIRFLLCCIRLVIDSLTTQNAMPNTSSQNSNFWSRTNHVRGRVDNRHAITTTCCMFLLQHSMSPVNIVTGD